MYTALILNDEDQQKLASAFQQQIPEGWASYFNPMNNWKLSHHMTINMSNASSGPAQDWLGKEAHVRVVSLAQDEKVVAVGVESDVPSTNKYKHITIAVNPEDGKPFLSNQLTKWLPVEPIVLKGVIQEV